MLVGPDTRNSPFRPQAPALDARKFRDPLRTASGERRASVAPGELRTLWFNTGTLCNIACATCYIESSPTNDALAYLTAAEVASYLDEIAELGLPTDEIALTGGEPFMNREIAAVMDQSLRRGFRVLVLTNAMRPMRRFETELGDLRARYGSGLTVRVSLDHYDPAVHEAERGNESWAPAISGLVWLAAAGLRIAVAG